MPRRFVLPDLAATERLGQSLANALRSEGGVILLAGDLGTGKTTLVRATLLALGYEGRVVSPSYTLVEPYLVGAHRVLHMDLYRLSDPEELEYLGIRDFDPQSDLLLVEWPEHGAGMLPPADLSLMLQDQGSGRLLGVEACSDKGRCWLSRLCANHESVG